VNGLTGTRRCARPVRIALSHFLGGDIDGAWWPHTSSLANELPDLIAALHPQLGEITDIGVNWSTTDGTPDLNSMYYGTATLPGSRPRRQRLIRIAGQRECIKLLVVPSMTSAALGLMVLRMAAGLRIPDSQCETKLFKTADCVVRAAQAEGASWAMRVASGEPAP
jgi:hypothetical protein